MSRPAGASWGAEGNVVTNAPGHQRSRAVASLNLNGVPFGGEGGMIVVWEDERNAPSSGLDLYYATVSRGGASVQATPFCTAPSTQSEPSVARTGAWSGQGPFNTLVVATWQDDRNLPTSAEDIYAQALFGSICSPGNCWGPDGISICTAPGTQSHPKVVGDEPSTFSTVIAWEDRRNGTDSDLYAQRLDQDGNAEWGSDGAPVCVAAGDQDHFDIVRAHDGGLLLAWEDHRNGPSPRVFVLRLLASGQVAPNWPANGLPVCDVSSAQNQPRIAVSPAGGILVFWSDRRDDVTGDLYAMRLADDGQPASGWPTSGLAVCTATGSQSPAHAHPSGTVVWVDGRNVGSEAPANFDLYAQRLLANGTVAAGWIPGGTVVCDEPSQQDQVNMVPSSGGSTMFAWRDWRANGVTSDIYGLCLDANGALAPDCPADGFAICAAAGDQSEPLGVFDPFGALVVWIDGRTSGVNGLDLYAQLAGQDGQTGDPVVDVADRLPTGFHLNRIYPNPARGTVRVDFDLPATMTVEVEILDLAGRGVSTLESGRLFPSGHHALVWDGRDRLGHLAPTGVYLVRASGSSRSASRRFVLLR
ncbi:MAG TPA: FlgD immunoglobulin-like domain containing protein [Candidatus Limnocylindria bacterium]|nr:FlgD immunoglobulin-like domain containing protein [Candidatus Limnocylindria bacterium]